MNQRTHVVLDKMLMSKLLDGLYNGAQRMALKVVVDTDGRYHIRSRGLDIVVEINPYGTGVERITVSNDKQFACVTKDELEQMKLLHFANSVYGILRDRYSPYIHSLAENIIVFRRTYYNPAIDNM